MAERFGDCIETFSGIRFYPCDARPGDIVLADVAHALAMMCRFAGHCRSFYSVAEHSVRVESEVSSRTGDRTVRAWALLHDAAEAYLGELTRPVKHMPEMKPYQDAERRLRDVIMDRFGLPREKPPVISEVDNVLLATEARDLKVNDPSIWGKWTGHITPLAPTIVPMSWDAAERLFLEAAARLGLTSPVP